MLCSPVAPTATKPRASAVRKSQKLADQASSSKGDKKERDPALPKKPSNPFFWFCQEHRAAVQEQCARESSAGHHELTKALARMWNDTSEEDKKASARAWTYTLCYCVCLLQCHGPTAYSFPLSPTTEVS